MAFWIRVLDVLFEDRLLLPSDPMLRAFHIAPCAGDGTRKSLAEIMNFVRKAAKSDGPVSSEFEEHLRCNQDFFGRALESLGKKILDVMNAKASELGDPNFTFFTTDVM